MKLERGRLEMHTTMWWRSPLESGYSKDRKGDGRIILRWMSGETSLWGREVDGSTTAYSVYLQLPSMTGGLPSIFYLRTRHAVVTRDPPNMACDYCDIIIFA
jgi:hypothetical protein